MLADFTVNVMILVCLYVLFANSLPLVRQYLAASTTAISLPLIVRSGTLRSIAVCALLFSVSHLHISLGFALTTLVPGVFWGWLYHRHRNLIGPAVSHVVVGGYVFFVLGV